jgi:hypothetical protein
MASRVRKRRRLSCPHESLASPASGVVNDAEKHAMATGVTFLKTDQKYVHQDTAKVTHPSLRA